MASVLACDWDTETLWQERNRFPTTLELIVGKFPRHSDAFYQWRLDDRLGRLEQSPNDDVLLDDIAVSYEKLKRYDEAIAVARSQLERNPDRYESLANLGTFFVHNNQLQEGLVLIEKAIKVNPNAHFGREKYQAILVKYVLSRTTDDGVELPLAKERFDSSSSMYDLPFRKFVRRELYPKEKWLTSDQRDEAQVAVLGMMRFSRHDSPILLEVLGELLAAGGAKQLAYRAYMSAANHASDGLAKKRYRMLASHILSHQLDSWKEANNVKVSERQIADDFVKEQADADAWYESLAAAELSWIEQGLAVDEVFHEKFSESPQSIKTDRDTERAETVGAYHDPASEQYLHAMLACSVLSVLIVTTLVVLAIHARRGSIAAKPSEDKCSTLTL